MVASLFNPRKKKSHKFSDNLEQFQINLLDITKSTKGLSTINVTS